MSQDKRHARQPEIRPSNFELVRWVRRMVRACDLTPSQAHVLLVLAGYANGECRCWPGIKRLAEDCGYKVKARANPKTGNDSHSSSAIEKALGELEGRGLIKTVSRGYRKPTVRELLYFPEERENLLDREEDDTHSILITAYTGTEEPVGMRTAANAADPHSFTSYAHRTDGDQADHRVHGDQEVAT